jgi:hypothetical protein
MSNNVQSNYLVEYNSPGNSNGKTNVVAYSEFEAMAKAMIELNRDPRFPVTVISAVRS